MQESDGDSFESPALPISLSRMGGGRPVLVQKAEQHSPSDTLRDFFPESGQLLGWATTEPPQ